MLLSYGVLFPSSFYDRCGKKGMTGSSSEHPNLCMSSSPQQFLFWLSGFLREASLIALQWMGYFINEGLP